MVESLVREEMAAQRSLVPLLELKTAITMLQKVAQGNRHRFGSPFGRSAQ
jgi:hypothetical protein